MTAVIAFTIIAFLLFGAACSITSIGKPRAPMTQGVALVTVIVALTISAGVYWLWAS